MSEREAYFERVAGTFEGHYIDHQHKYDDTPRESDRILVEIVREVTGGKAGTSVLDIGCSTGNLLVHVRRAMPDLTLVGGDLALAAVEVARQNPELAGVTFEEMDITALPASGFDVIVVNAVFYALADDLFDKALASIASALAPGGHLIAFDYFHPYHQDLVVEERSEPQPQGALLHFRPMAGTSRRLEGHGFTGADFRPFEIPIDLPRRAQANEDAWADLETWTIPTAGGSRILMRGPISQPWCHLVARREG